jgi:hypothetical protein
MQWHWWTSLVALSVGLSAVTGAGWILWKVARGMWRLGRKLNRFLDQTLGDREAGIPSLMDQVAEVAETQIEQGLQLARQAQELAAQGRALAAQAKAHAEHVRWHGDPGGQPAEPSRWRPNGGPSKRSRRQPPAAESKGNVE